MNITKQLAPELEGAAKLHSELLLLPDGRVLVHNLTQTMAIVLHELNPCEDVIRLRAEAGSESQNVRPIT